MIILGIESSCDETAAALFQSDGSGKGRVISERVASQIDTHARYGGVVPEIASREHLAVLPSLVEEVMEKAGLSFGELDGIAVTAGPGLMGALLVGVSFARGLAAVHDLPLVPVHHMEGHLLAPGLSEQGLPEFPFISLLVSGGHTMLVRVDGVGKYQVIGQTIDDAAGECFDKSARLLGLPYPGGPEVSRLALEGDRKRFRFPRPMLNQDNLNFSFSGLKTAVMYKARELGDLDEQTKADLAAGLEDAIVDVLVKKCMKACRQEDVPRLIIAGGVAANQHLRAQLHRFASRQNVQVYLPEPQYCTDNAAMIAYAGSLRAFLSDVTASAWDARARWKLADIAGC